MLTLDEPQHLAHGFADEEKIIVSRGQSGAVTVSNGPMTASGICHVRHNPKVGSQFVHDDVLHEGDEPLLTALGKLQVADSNWVPEEGKRMIVEAMIIRELDQEEGFLDFSSF